MEAEGVDDYSGDCFLNRCASIVRSLVMIRVNFWVLCSLDSLFECVS